MEVLLVCSSLHTVDAGYSLDGFVIEPRSFRGELEEAQNRHDYESEIPFPSLPTKQQILSCLAVHGHWITTQPELQVCRARRRSQGTKEASPPDSINSL